MNQAAVRISDQELGERLRVAREGRGMSQANAADTIGVARTTLVAMEQGQRKARIGELQQLAVMYGVSVNSLLRQESVHVDLEPRFRKLSGSDRAASGAGKLLSDLVKAEVELENLLGIKRQENYPAERPLQHGDVAAQAEQDAADLRHRLGIGAGPVPDLVSLLELEIGARVYVRKMDSRISGLFAFERDLGPCILLNASHPRERRQQSGAHELGHFIGTRSRPEIQHFDEEENSREERYANVFARAFLTPVRAVMQRFGDITAGADRLTRRHVIVMSNFFGVSRQAMVRRLEELQLVKKGTWDWFQANGGITDEQARQVLGDLVVPDQERAAAGRPTTLRLGLLAAEAMRRELLTEGQLARLLQLDRVELRELLSTLELERGAEHGPALPLR